VLATLSYASYIVITEASLHQLQQNITFIQHWLLAERITRKMAQNV